MPKQLELNKIYKQDSLSFLDRLKQDEISPDLIFTDPPYNLSGSNLKLTNNTTGGSFYKVNEAWDIMEEDEYFDFTYKWIEKSFNIQKDGASIYVCCSYHNIGEVTMAIKQVGYSIKNIITWAKTNPMPSITKRTYTHSSEFIVYAVKNKKWTFNYDVLKEINPDRTKDGQNRQMRDVWSLPQCQGQERIKDPETKRAIHPTQKLEELVKRAVLASSNENDLVLDLFMGSGTTAVVAQRYNRAFIGCDLEEKYIEVANKRLQKEQTCKRT